jgi:hypothetical protein
MVIFVFLVHMLAYARAIFVQEWRIDFGVALTANESDIFQMLLTDD